MKAILRGECVVTCEEERVCEESEVRRIRGVRVRGVNSYRRRSRGVKWKGVVDSWMCEQLEV